MHYLELLALSDGQIKQTGFDFVRFLYQKIDWSARLIGIKGTRGTGKTTLLLQKAASDGNMAPYVVHLSLDELYFTSQNLLDTVDELQKKGLKNLYLDEVHKYPTWSREIKLIYDRYPQLKVVFTGSSIIDISKEEGDLNRRTLMYTLPGLSYREFLELEYGIKLPILTIGEILQPPDDTQFPTGFKPLEHFSEYLHLGYYPFYRESKDHYPQLLRQLVRTVIEYDMLELPDFYIANAKKLLHLLTIIAAQVPFKPNLSKLASKTGLHRNMLNNYLQYLAQANLIHLLYSKPYSTASLQKPQKIFLNNTNLIYALAELPPDIGTVREHFAISQLSESHQLNQSDQADFLVDNRWQLEIGGKNKANKAYREQVTLILDHLEYPVASQIPLWMLGLLY